jgi:hypothetical protein
MQRDAFTVRRVPRRSLVAIAGLLLAACLDFSTSPDEIAFLAFTQLPSPSVVRGDTLRDSTGAAAPLVARAVNAGGDEVSSTRLRYYSVGDTAEVLEVDSVTGTVVSSEAEPQAVRLIASIGSLQSPPLNLVITKRPDSLALTRERDTINYSFADTTRNYSDPLTVTLLHNDSTTFFSGVNAWVVRYQLESPDDTMMASLVDDSNRRLRSEPTGVMHIDTTSGDGTAARKLRIAPGALLAAVDSVAIIVEAKHRGVHVAGSPARIVVLVRPGS